MDLALHANATTTPKTRSYIQRSKKPVAELVAELGVSETTISLARPDHGRRPLAPAQQADDEPVGHGRDAGLRAANIAAVAAGRYRRGDAAVRQREAVPQRHPSLPAAPWRQPTQET